MTPFRIRNLEHACSQTGADLLAFVLVDGELRPVLAVMTTAHLGPDLVGDKQGLVLTVEEVRMKSTKQQRVDQAQLARALKKCLLAYGIRPTINDLASAIEQLAKAGERVSLWPDDENPLDRDDLLAVAQNLRDSNLF